MKKEIKASSLVLAILILTAISVIGLSLALTSTRDRKSTMESARSNQAFYNADTGIEKVMNAITKAGSDDTVNDISGWNNGIISGTNYKVELEDKDGNKITLGSTPISEVDRIKSVGTDSGSGEKRAIEAAVAATGDGGITGGCTVRAGSIVYKWKDGCNSIKTPVSSGTLDVIEGESCNQAAALGYECGPAGSMEYSDGDDPSYCTCVKS